MQQKSSSEIKEIAALVNRLMNHHWTADEPSTLRQAQAEDWLEDLIEFSPAIVAEACRQWRRKPGSRRPLPGDIRVLCIAEHREQSERRALPASSPADMDAQDWPRWLEDIYGPRPDGPLQRAEALRKAAERKREIERRLSRPVALGLEQQESAE